MFSDIVLSSAIRSNLITLQNTSEMQAKVQERLATGKKVNSALDNPTSFFTAAGLTRRASDLSALLDGMAQGIKTLEAADSAMKAITKTVESMQAYVRQARADKSFQGKSLTIDNATIGTASTKSLSFTGGALGTASVSLDLNTTGLGTKSTVSMSAAYAPPSAAAQATYTAQNAYTAPTATQALTIAFNGGSTDVSLTTAETSVALAVTKINNAIAADADSAGKFEAYDNGGKLAIRSTGNVDGNIAVTGAGETAIFGTQVQTAGSNGQTNFTVNGAAVTLTTAETTAALAVAKANSDLGPLSEFEAFDDAGKLGIRTKTSSATAITIGGPDAGLFGAATTGTPAGAVKTVDELVSAIRANPALTDRVRASNDGGKLRIDNLSTEEMTVTGIGSTSGQVDGSSGTAKVAGNDVRKNLITQFNELRTQLDKLAGDAGYNGVNLLRADKLKVVFNESSTSELEIQARSVSGVVRGIGTEPGSLAIGAADGTEFSSDASLELRLGGLSRALTTLQTQASSFGANLTVVQNRQDFTKAMINTLRGGADNLTLADANEEGASLLALNTRQQLSQTSLSLASQASQAVLRLFG